MIPRPVRRDEDTSSRTNYGSGFRVYVLKD